MTTVEEEVDGAVGEAPVNEELAYRALCVQSILATQSGRDYFWLLMDELRVFGSAWNKDASPSVRDFEAGMRGAGLVILEDLQIHCPGYYVQMINEKLGSK